MGVRNYLIEGVSGTGKTSVCHELRRRGYQALNGDRDLAYKGDPATGKPILNVPDGQGHYYHLWDVTKVADIAADTSAPATFFCGGSRNFPQFIDLFDRVFVLDVDAETLRQRLEQRPKDEWGSHPEERDFIMRLHASREDIPTDSITIDATRPLSDVVDTILSYCTLSQRPPSIA
ncbi:nucleoside kinase [Devosia pacifica]|uniref:Nucleoside kinase n=1 Tax=Devosia pacifica TaxID=1335967 RepID=A0A918RXK3_9HYPH|nr:AAA family ATPase [Devosia pacifica]GHA13123.1 nucleoside kinase [Devosia pacifica]